MPAVLALAAAARRSDHPPTRRTLLATAGAGLVVVGVAPFQFFHGDPTRWSVVQTVLGNAFCLWGLGLLVVMVVLGRVRTTASTPRDGQAAGSDRTVVAGG
ncbi:MAG: hypothetical protein PGN29_14860 [Gordonia paraffinivorans]